MCHLSPRFVRFIVIILLLLLASLACSIQKDDQGQADIDIQLTTIAIQQTQTAVVVPPIQIPTTENVQPTQPVAVTESIPTPSPDIDFEGISFSFDDSITSSVSTEIVPQQVDEYQFPGGTYPTHYAFNFNGYALQDTFHQPIIRIYPIAMFETLDSYTSDDINQLHTLLQTQPPIAVNDNLPLIPHWNAGQMFSAKAEYLDFQNGSGVRYLTMHGQAAYPIDNTNMFYAFQGITNDGAYLVSAILPIANPALPLHGEDTIDNWTTFYDLYESYMGQASQQVNEYEAISFVPSLDMLDAMIASIYVNK